MHSISLIYSIILDPFTEHGPFWWSASSDACKSSRQTRKMVRESHRLSMCHLTKICKLMKATWRARRYLHSADDLIWREYSPLMIALPFSRRRGLILESALTFGIWIVVSARISKTWKDMNPARFHSSRPYLTTRFVRSLLQPFSQSAFLPRITLTHPLKRWGHSITITAVAYNTQIFWHQQNTVSSTSKILLTISWSPLRSALFFSIVAFKRISSLKPLSQFTHISRPQRLWTLLSTSRTSEQASIKPSPAMRFGLYKPVISTAMQTSDLGIVRLLLCGPLIGWATISFSTAVQL